MVHVVCACDGVHVIMYIMPAIVSVIVSGIVSVIVSQIVCVMLLCT